MREKIETRSRCAKIWYQTVEGVLTDTPTVTPTPSTLAVAPTNTSTPTPTQTPTPTSTSTPTPVPTPPPLSTPIIFETRIADINDDAEERVAGGKVRPGSGDLELTNDSELPNAAEDGGDQIIGLRFQSVRVPKGTIIQQAYIEFTVDEAGHQPTSLTIYGHAHDNAPPFEKDDAKNISKRLDSATEPVLWPNVPPWDEIGEKQTTPDLTLIVQEIINRDGWQSGNAMAFIITGTQKSSRIAAAYDTNEGTDKPPLLHIEYSVP